MVCVLSVKGEGETAETQRKNVQENLGSSPGSIRQVSSSRGDVWTEPWLKNTSKMCTLTKKNVMKGKLALRLMGRPRSLSLERSNGGQCFLACAAGVVC